MKRNSVKTLLATTFTLIVLVSGSKMNARAITREEFAAMKGVAVEEISKNEDLREEYLSIKFDEATGGDVDAFLNNIAMTAIAKEHPEMVAYVNADRAAYGVNALAWDADLAVYAKQRAVEVMNNYHSSEFAAAYATGGDWTSVVHRGCREQTGENAVFDNGNFGVGTADKYNTAWINSVSHHNNRIRAGVTKYAAASYVDSFTGDTVWVELFEYGTPAANSASFDYVRYANENPDVAAVFGQNNAALYNHYITCGVFEGRKAYYTNGAVIK